nr:hypothetical protein [Tanacetum cinerariifolium]
VTDTFSVANTYQQRTASTNKSFSQTVNTARPRPVNTVRPRPVNIARPRPVNTARPNSAVVNIVRSHPQKEDQGYVDSGCSRHITGNMPYLLDFKEFNRGSDTSITPPTAAASPRLTASAKGKQTTKASKAKSLSALFEPSGSGAEEGTGSKLGAPDVPVDESEEELFWNSTDNEGDDNEEKDADDDEEDEGDNGEEENGDDDRDDDDEDDDGEEGDDDDANQEVVRDDDKDDNEEGGDDEHESDEETRDEESFDPIPQSPEDSKYEGDGEEDLGLNIGEEERHVEEEEEDELYKDVNINQGRRIQATLEVKDSHVTLTPVKPDGMESIFGTTSQMDVQTPTSVASLPIIAPTMTSSTIAITTTTSQAPILPTTISSTIIQNLPNFGLLFRFDDRLRSFHSSRTSYVVAADLSKMELKKIFIEKMEGNKSVQCLNEQRNLYKALVEAYESDKEGKEPESASAPMETITRSAGRSTQGSRSRQELASESALAEEPMQNTSQMEEPSHPKFDTEWYSYKYLDGITVRRDDDKLYKFKEGNFKRLRIQDIEDMLLLLVQGKLTNLTVQERFAFNNKDKRNRLIWIDELHKFSDGTLIDDRTALDDRLKGIRMQYLPQSIWRKSDKDGASAMIQAIDKRLKTRRIMRSLERFVGGRLYEGDFRMLQRTI